MSEDNATPVLPEPTAEDLQQMQKIVTTLKTNSSVAILVLSMMILAILWRPLAGCLFYLGVLIISIIFLASVFTFCKTPNSVIAHGRFWGKCSFVFVILSVLAYVVAEPVISFAQQTNDKEMLWFGDMVFLSDILFYLIFFFCFLMYFAKISAQINTGKKLVTAMFFSYFLAAGSILSVIFFPRLIIYDYLIYVIRAAFMLWLVFWIGYLSYIIPALGRYVRSLYPRTNIKTAANTFETTRPETTNSEISPEESGTQPSPTDGEFKNQD